MSILVLTSDTLIGTAATGNIEYSGQFYGTDSNASRAQIQRITQGTAVASTSGTSIDFTSIPSWVKRITVMFNGVSLSATSNIQFQLGTGSTTYTTSGYNCSSTLTGTASATSNATAGFLLYDVAATAASLYYGSTIFTNINGNNWVAVGQFALPARTLNLWTTGSIALGAALTAVRITTVNGTDTFDAGSINILYEG
jgi:hypothetical protein